MNGYSLLSFGLGIAYISLLVLVIYIKADFKTRYGIVRRLAVFAIGIGAMFGCLYLVRDHYLSAFAAGLYVGMFGALATFIYRIVTRAKMSEQLQNGQIASQMVLHWGPLLIRVSLGIAFFLTLLFISHWAGLLHHL